MYAQDDTVVSQRSMRSSGVLGRMTKSAIEFQNVSKRFRVPGKAQGDADPYMRALDRLSYHIADREVVGIVGPSGCGKSTTLKLIAGLDFPDEGRVLVNEREVERPNASIGFMLQKDLLMPWKTVLENAELGLAVRGVPKKERQERARSVLENYGLGDFVNYRPHEISGGMRQRVALARTMTIDPKLLLLDEPFAALDFQTKLILQQHLLTILQKSGMTALYITHDIGEALCLCRRVLVMTSRPGRIKMEHVTSIPADLDIIEKRNSATFGEEFQLIWKSLDIDVKMTGGLVRG